MEIKLSSLIELNNIVKTYSSGETRVLALNHINLKIEQHELLAIIGESGSGKSTMMNIVGLLDKPSSGSYQLKGKEVAKLSEDELAAIRNQTIGFVFQSFFLLPRSNAIKNVAIPLLYRDKSLKEAKDTALSMLEKWGLKT